MFFELPHPTEALMYQDSSTYTDMEVFQTLKMIAGEDSPYAIKNSLPKLCSLLHYARQSRNRQILLMFMQFLLDQNLGDREKEDNLRIKLYLSYHIACMKFIGPLAAQLCWQQIFDCLFYLEGEEISIYKLYMFHIMNKYFNNDDLVITIIQVVLDGVIETQKWALFLRFLIRQFFQPNPQINNVVVLINSLYKTLNHQMTAMQLQYKIIRYFMTVKDSFGLKVFKDYLASSQLLQPSQYLMQYHVFRPLRNHHSNTIRNGFIDLLRRNFQVVRQLRENKHDQNIVDSLFNELESMNLSERDEMELIIDHYLFSFGKMDLQRLKRTNPHNKSPLFTYIKKTPVGVIDKPRLLNVPKNAFPNQQRETILEFFQRGSEDYFNYDRFQANLNKHADETLGSLFDLEVDPDCLDADDEDPDAIFMRELKYKYQRCSSDMLDQVDICSEFQIEMHVDYILDLQHLLVQDFVGLFQEKQFHVRQHALKCLQVLLKSHTFESSSLKLINNAIVGCVQDSKQSIRYDVLKVFEQIISHYYSKLCVPFKLRYFLSSLQIQGLIKYQQELITKKIQNIDQFKFGIKDVLPKDQLKEFGNHVHLKGLLSEARMIIKLIVLENRVDYVIDNYQELLQLVRKFKPLLLLSIQSRQNKDCQRIAVEIACDLVEKKLIGSEQLLRNIFALIEHNDENSIMVLNPYPFYDILFFYHHNTRENMLQIFRLVRFMTDVEFQGFSLVFKYFLLRQRRFQLPYGFYQQVHAQLQFGSGNQLEALKIMSIYFEKFPMLLNEQRLIELKKLIQFEKIQPYQNILMLRQIITILTRYFKRSALSIVHQCQDELIQIITMNMGSLDTEWFNIIDMVFDMIQENQEEWQPRIQCCIYWMIKVCKNLIKHDMSINGKLTSQLKQKGFTNFFGLDKRDVNLNHKIEDTKWIFNGFDVFSKLNVPDIPGSDDNPQMLIKSKQKDRKNVLRTVTASKVLYQKYKKYSHLMPNTLQTAEILLSKNSYEITVETYLTAQAQVIQAIGKFSSLHCDQVDLLLYDYEELQNRADLEQEVVRNFKHTQLFKRLKHYYSLFTYGKVTRQHSQRTKKVMHRHQVRNYTQARYGRKRGAFLARGAKYLREEVYQNNYLSNYQRKKNLKPRQKKAIFTLKKFRKIENYSYYNLFKDVNAKGKFNSKISVEIMFKRLQKLFRQVNNINRILDKYFVDESVLNKCDIEVPLIPKQQNKLKMLNLLKNFQTIALMYNGKDVTYDEIVYWKQIFKPLVKIWPEEKIDGLFRVLKKRGIKYHPYNVVTKREQQYYDTPSMKMIIKQRYKSILKLKMQSKYIEKNISERKKVLPTVRNKLIKIQRNIRREQLKQEIEMANFNPKLRAYLKEISTNLKELLLRWCSMKDQKEFQLTRDLMFKIMRNFATLPREKRVAKYMRSRICNFKSKISNLFLLENINVVKDKAYRGFIIEKNYLQEFSRFQKQLFLYRQKKKQIRLAKQKLRRLIKVEQMKQMKQVKQVNQVKQVKQAKQVQKKRRNKKRLRRYKIIRDIMKKELFKFVNKYKMILFLFMRKYKLKIKYIPKQKLFKSIRSEWFIDPRLSQFAKKFLFEVQKYLKYPMIGKIKSIKQEYGRKRKGRQFRIYKKANIIKETTSSWNLRFQEKYKQEIFTDPGIIYNLRQYCLKMLQAFKKETLHLGPSQSCRVNWEYVDGIPEKQENYRISLKKSRFWPSKINQKEQCSERFFEVEFRRTKKLQQILEEEPEEKPFIYRPGYDKYIIRDNGGVQVSKFSKRVYDLVKEYCDLRSDVIYKRRYQQILLQYDEDGNKTARTKQQEIFKQIVRDDEEDNEDQQNIKDEIQDQDKGEQEISENKDQQELQVQEDSEDSEDSEDEDQKPIQLNLALQNEEKKRRLKEKSLAREKLRQERRKNLEFMQKEIQQAFEDDSEVDQIIDTKKNKKRKAQEIYKASAVIMFLQDFWEQYQEQGFDVEEDEIEDGQDTDMEPESTFKSIISQYLEEKKINVARKIRKIKQIELAEDIQNEQNVNSDIIDDADQNLDMEKFNFPNDLYDLSLNFLFPDQQQDESQFYEFQPISLENLQFKKSHRVIAKDLINKIKDINQLCDGKKFQVKTQQKFINNRCLHEDQDEIVEDDIDIGYFHHELSIDDCYSLLLDTRMQNDLKKKIFLDYCIIELSKNNSKYESVNEILLEFTNKQMIRFEKYLLEEIDKKGDSKQVFRNHVNFGEQQLQWLTRVRPALGQKIRDLRLLPSIKQFNQPKGVYQIKQTQWQPSSIFFVALNTFLKIQLMAQECKRIDLEIICQINNNPYTPSQMKINIMYFLFEIIQYNTEGFSHFKSMISTNINLGDTEVQEVTVKCLIILLRIGHVQERDYLKILINALNSEKETVRLMVHSYLKYFSENDQYNYMMLLYIVLIDESLNRYKYIHAYLSYIKESNYGTLTEMLIQSFENSCIIFFFKLFLGKEAQYNSIYIISMICTPKILQRFNEWWKRIMLEIHEEKTLIAISLIFYKYRFYVKREVFIEGIKNINLIRLIARDRPDLFKLKPFNTFRRWYHCIFGEILREQRQKQIQERGELGQGTQFQYDDDPVKVALTKFIGNLFFTTNKKLRIEINNSLNTHINELRNKNPRQYENNMQEVIKKVKQVIAEKQNTDKKYTDKFIRDKYKNYFQSFFDLPESNFVNEPSDDEYPILQIQSPKSKVQSEESSEISDQSIQE